MLNLAFILLAGCQPAPPTWPADYDLLEIQDFTWELRYGIRAGERILDAGDFDRQLYIAFTTPGFKDEACDYLSSGEDVPEGAFCFDAFDGCNRNWGAYEIQDDGTLEIFGGFQELLGCPETYAISTDPATGRSELETIATTVYDPASFGEALFSAVAYSYSRNELRLYYPESMKNYLVFKRAGPFEFSE